MQSDRRNLSAGMSGNDVLLLKVKLRLISDGQPANPQLSRIVTNVAVRTLSSEAALFDAGTVQTVRTIQEKSGLPATGIADEATLARIDGMVAESGRRAVFGFVRTDRGGGVDGLTITASDRDMRQEQVLATVKTTGEGFYFAPYEKSAFSRAEKGHADLILRALDATGKQTLAVSATRFNAEPIARIDLSLTQTAKTGDSEFERWTKTIAPLIETVTPDQLSDEDLRFLNGETGIAFDDLHALKLDAVYRQKVKLEAGVFYGLLRQALPRELNLLLLEKRSRWQSALKTSLAENLVPAALGAKLDQIIGTLHQMALDAVQAPASDAAAPSLGQTISAAGIPKDTAVRFVDFALKYEGDESEFWSKARSESKLDDKSLDAIQFAVTSAKLVYGHPKMVAALQSLRNTRQWRKVSDIARLKRGDWQALAKQAGYPKAFADSTTFAEAIADHVETAFPSAVAIHRLVEDPKLGDADLRAFFERNPDFDLLRARIDETADLGGVKDANATRRTLMALQNTMRIAPANRRYETMRALIDNKIASSLDIVRMGERDFLTMLTPVIGKASAMQVFEKTVGRAKATQMLHQRFRDYFDSPIHVLPNANLPSDVEMPSWTKLFGAITACACEHCRSMYSPAAYLVDILQFLKDVPGETRPLERLSNRRPDIQHIALNCANANTPLPVIDLVNEILEGAVADGGAVDWRRYQTAEPADGETGDAVAGRLRAFPQNQLSAAYDRLSTAVYPWGLPFHADHERLRLFAAHLGVDFATIRRLFRRDETVATRDALKLSQAEWTILTRESAAADVATLWHVADLAEIEAPSTILDRTGLTFDALRDLTQTWFLSGDGLAEVNLVSSDADDADPCKLESYRIDGLRDGRGMVANRLDQIHRFLRLQRRLGWSVDTLDTVLSALGHRQIEEATLSTLARVIGTAEDYGVTAESLVTATGPALARIMDMAESDAGILAALSGAAEIGSLDARARLRLLEDGLAFQRTGFAVRDAAYILQDRDQVPAAFAPAEADILAFLRQLHGFIAQEKRARAVSDLMIDDLIVENVATNLALAPDICDRLLRPRIDPETGRETTGAWMPAESDAALPAIRDLSRFAAIPEAGGMPPDETDPAATGKAVSLFLRISRVARLLRPLAVTGPQLDVIRELGAANGFIDIGGIGISTGLSDRQLFDGFLALCHAARLRDDLPRGESDLFDFMRQAGNTALPDADFFALLSRDTGWSIDPATGDTAVDDGGHATDIPRDLSIRMGFNRDAFRQAATYATLAEAVHLIRRWRIRPETLQLWSDPVQPDGIIADGLQAAARSRHATDDAWHETVTPLMDVLRERKRAALLGYLLTVPAASGTVPRWQDAAAIYGHFLIDPEVSACLLTSRIKQASASVQLFAQRILMNLEDDLRPLPATAEQWSGHWRKWEWIKNYRVWEAGRKIFLYPENWIQPELRDDKSPFFRELENELLQDEINDVNASRTYRNYLTKLVEVSRLDVRALYLERSGGDRADILHVFSRSFSEPFTYFHRRRDMTTGVWETWQKLDINIEGDHLIPAIQDGQLMLFWPRFREIEDGASWELSLASSVYREDRWQPAKMGSAKATVPGHSQADFSFRLDTIDGRLAILVFRQFYSRAAGRSGSAESYSLCDHAFTYDVCNGAMRWEAVRPVRVLLHPDRVDAAGMTFTEDASPGDELLVLNGAITDDTIDLPPELSEVLQELLSEGGLGGAIVAALLGGAAALSDLRRIQDQASSHALLRRTPGVFQLVPAHQDRQFTSAYPFFFQDRDRCFFVEPYEEVLSLAIGRTPAWTFSDGAPFIGLRGITLFLQKYRFRGFYHAYICHLMEHFSADGIAGLLAPPSFTSSGTLLSRRTLFDRQYTPPAPSPLADYQPTALVGAPLPVETISFDLGEADGAYNWELFFHIPMLIAIRLSQAQRFDEAQRWFHYVFDPTDTSPHPVPAKFWRVKPFFELSESPPETLTELLRRIAMDDEETARQVAVWRADPANPHAIARLRRLAYMKSVVMAYLDNLIAWADNLFTLNTMESINEATQLYILAAQILGPRPFSLSHQEAPAFSYAELTEAGSAIDELGNAWLELESLLPADLGATTRTGREDASGLIPYFCIPSNDKLRGYWNTVADRLFKIRHCMNIEGQRQQLPLFEPPIDPALLVRARAAGIDLRTVLSRHDAAVPTYRYAVSHQKAVEFCADVRALGSALLSALEQNDAQQLTRLRQRHEATMLNALSRIKDSHVEEARMALRALQDNLKAAEARYQYYNTRDYRNRAEQAHVDHLHVAHGIEMTAQGIKALSPILYSIPNITVGLGAGTTFGGTHLGSAVNAAADAINMIATQFAFEANMSSLSGGHDRRIDDWRHQAEQAQHDIAQIEKQIVGAEIRVAIAEREQENHRQQMDQSAEIQALMNDRFTNQELYGWMAGQLASLHQQAYQMAVDLAFSAQTAGERDLGLRPGELDVIAFTHFEAGRRGLLAGERLHHDLRRLETAYLERSRRTLEITKHVSLASLLPLSLLQLKETGTCEFGLPEWLFDLDYPGHYNRRIKAVSLTIPCITGPYTNVSCTLTLTGNQIRYTPATAPEAGPRMTQSIATSSAQNDGGVFELNFRDERYLPFEGAGAVSDWRIELSGKWRLDIDGDGTEEAIDLSQFDFASISDVILHVSYFAQPAADGGTLKTSALTNLRRLLSSAADAPLFRYVSLRHEFPDAWNRLQRPAAGAGESAVLLALTADRFPFLTKGKDIAIAGYDVILVPRPDTDGPFDATDLAMAFTPDGTTGSGRSDNLVFNPWMGLPRGTRTVDASPGTWTLRVTASGDSSNLSALQDIIIVLRYSCGSNPG